MNSILKNYQKTQEDEPPINKVDDNYLKTTGEFKNVVPCDSTILLKPGSMSFKRVDRQNEQRQHSFDNNEQPMSRTTPLQPPQSSPIIQPLQTPQSSPMNKPLQPPQSPNNSIQLYYSPTSSLLPQPHQSIQSCPPPPPPIPSHTTQPSPIFQPPQTPQSSPMNKPLQPPQSSPIFQPLQPPQSSNKTRKRSLPSMTLTNNQIISDDKVYELLSPKSPISDISSSPPNSPTPKRSR